MDAGACVAIEETKKGATAGQLAFAGIILGAAAGLVVGMVKK